MIMSRCLPLLLSLFLLCGCAAQNPIPATADIPITAVAPEVPINGFYDGNGRSIIVATHERKNFNYEIKLIHLL